MSEQEQKATQPETEKETPLESVCRCGNGAKCCRWTGGSPDHACGGNCGAHTKE